MLLHTIGKLGQVPSAPDPFTDKYIFPGYHLPSLSQMADGERAGAADRQRRRECCGCIMPTRCAHWLERATAARAEIEAMYDERFFRMWEFYLAGGIVMFESGAACNYQVQYIRDRNALPITRDYMAGSRSALPEACRRIRRSQRRSAQKLPSWQSKRARRENAEPSRDCLV